MANHQAVKQWFLHGASLQLQQRTTVRHNSLTTSLIFLSTPKAALVTSRLELEAGLDTLELSIESLLHAELHIGHCYRASPALGRVEEGFESLCQLLRPISIHETPINPLERLLLPLLQIRIHITLLSQLSISRRSLRHSCYDTNTIPIPPQRIGVFYTLYYYNHRRLYKKHTTMEHTSHISPISSWALQNFIG